MKLATTCELKYVCELTESQKLEIWKLFMMKLKHFREAGHYHDCWFPGSLCHQVISSHIPVSQMFHMCCCCCHYFDKILVTVIFTTSSEACDESSMILKYALTRW